MKAIILCAGRGTRLQPLTFSHAKHLIPIANKPVMFYGLEAIIEAGIQEVGLVVGENRSDFVQEVGHGERWGIHISYIVQEEPKGLAHAAKTAQSFVGDEPFVMYLGDNIFQHGLKEAVKLYRAYQPQAMTLLYEVDDPRAYGVAELDQDRVLRVVEKPKEPKSNWALTGAYIFDPLVFEIIDQLQPSWRGEYEITDAIQGLIERGAQVRPYFVRGWWVDTGNADDMLQANRLILRQIESSIAADAQIDPHSEIVGDIILGPGAQIVNSTVRGPAIIGRESRLEDSFIGPFTSIGAQVQIQHSEIEHSIILDGCTIRNIDGRIEDSVFGRNITLLRDDHRPKVHKFLLADNSQVRLV
ncbi:MAG: glucose-1-phosphate thymidylyltransferase [Chloroflexia bacterium]|nr:glucose-1-phosphate thymidylyltransferase [Chloroflexia bacterium]